MNKVLVFALLFTLSSYNILAQEKAQKKANRAYENFLYERAINLFEKIEQPDAEALRNLADCYIKTQQYSKIESVYEKLIDSLPYTPQDFWNYAESVKYNKNYQKYDTLLNIYFNRFSETERAEKLSTEYLGFKQMLNEEPRYEYLPLNINTSNQEFGLNYFGDSVIFVSTGSNQKISKDVWSVNQMPFLDLYIGIPSDTGNLSKVQEFDTDIESNYHYGPVSFADNNKRIVFTRNDAEASSNQIIRLQLYYSEYKNSKWSREKPLSLNSPDYSVGHPAIDEKNKRLYFASDMPGGFGGIDIYYCNYDENWNLSNITNLGSQVNTPSNEMFPFYHEKGYLFFASNGHLSLGGLDNYLVKLDSSSQEVIYIQNMGKPVNSNYDDFSLVLDEQMESGYFSSDREEGKGSDDIFYFFKTKETIVHPYIAQVFAISSEGDTLKNFDLETKTASALINKSFVTDSFKTLDLTPGNFSFKASKEGFRADSTHLNIIASQFNYVVILKLEKIKPVNLSVYTKDSATKLFLPNSKLKITYLNEINQDTIFGETNKKGSFNTIIENINDSITVYVEALKDGYQKAMVKNTFLPFSGMEKEIELYLSPELVTETVKEIMEEPIAEKIDPEPTKTPPLAEEIINIEPIYFDFDKSKVEDHEKKRLDEIIKILNNHPTWKLELKAYTDCQGDSAYNIVLSKQRANRTMAYLAKQINSNRIIANGYGEANPVIDCKCDVPKPICTIEQQKMNRRTEFYLIK